MDELPPPDRPDDDPFNVTPQGSYDFAAADCNINDGSSDITAPPDTYGYPGRLGPERHIIEPAFELPSAQEQAQAAQIFGQTIGDHTKQTGVLGKYANIVHGDSPTAFRQQLILKRVVNGSEELIAVGKTTAYNPAEATFVAVPIVHFQSSTGGPEKVYVSNGEQTQITRRTMTSPTVFTARPGDKPSSVLLNDIVSVNAGMDAGYDLEGAMGLNDQPIHPREAQEIAEVLRAAVPLDVSAHDLNSLAVRRRESRFPITNYGDASVYCAALNFRQIISDRIQSPFYSPVVDGDTRTEPSIDAYANTLELTYADPQSGDTTLTIAATENISEAALEAHLIERHFPKNQATLIANHAAGATRTTKLTYDIVSVQSPNGKYVYDVLRTTYEEHVTALDGTAICSLPAQSTVADQDEIEGLRYFLFSPAVNRWEED